MANNPLVFQFHNIAIIGSSVRLWNKGRGSAIGGPCAPSRADKDKGTGTMRISHRIIGAAGLAAMLATTACTTDPNTGQRSISKAAIGGIGGALGGYLLGDIVGGRRDRTEKIVGAGIGGIAGAAIGAYMDKQEREMRARTAGTDVQVVRQGDDLLLNIPSGINFAYNSATIEPRFRATLDRVASVLSEYNQSYIDVYGFTDSTGSEDYNQGLSERRAASVAARACTARRPLRGIGCLPRGAVRR